MFDLHTHSLLSDGELLPSELARRYEEKGFKAIAITDHVDLSNLKNVVAAITDFYSHWPKNRIKVIPGIELTHMPPEQFKKATDFARNNGIKLIVAHGETLVEPVVRGTNKAALNAKIDILAHPGLISEEEVKLAARKGVLLELSSRKGHCLTNGHVARLAIKYGAKLCLNSDAHAPSDIPTLQAVREVGLGAGLSEKDVSRIYKDLNNFIRLHAENHGCKPVDECREVHSGEMSLQHVEGGPRRREAAAGFSGTTAVKPWGSIRF